MQSNSFVMKYKISMVSLVAVLVLVIYTFKYVIKSFSNFCNAQGIDHQTLCVYTT